MEFFVGLGVGKKGEVGHWWWVGGYRWFFLVVGWVAVLEYRGLGFEIKN